ncbi:sensor domain-containing diguanylate cyclase [Marinobacterium weihaiense]|uniref:diguanylate cyclase n=1 Tax=Marinobacterium weihaiense TaxID=2851016 RepID=A0ABS6MDX3_9GAMM|nr:sensor domain-containing diguanylate cyclase [Marinobacterium weihaiense]MBV0934497.1 GGDEF domain-containing protein [Marinobacterium weihaiense]
MYLDRNEMLMVLNALPDPVFVLTESGLYVGLFGNADPRFYHDGHDLVGRSIQDVLPESITGLVMEHIRLALEKNGLVKVEYPLAEALIEGHAARPGPKGMLWFEGHVQPFPHRVNGERTVIWVARNITRRKMLEQELLDASQADPLTHTANRRQLLEALQSHFVEYQRYGHPLSLIMFDLDRFKRLNDRFGHLAGDQVLCHVCELCRHMIRETDLLARFGGEEFILVLPSTAAPQAFQMAERLREAIAERVPPQMDAGMDVTVSLGVSELQPHDRHYEQLIKRADEALYQAKGEGRNKTVLLQPE